MEKFIQVSGVAVPLPNNNVDTDQILPAKYLKRITKTGFADALFSNWRQDPDFVLNKPEFAAGRVLFAGRDFGIGSSREHAVWALNDYGFRAVFSPRFGDIFRGNAGKQGLLAGVIEQADMERIWALIERHPGVEAWVDLEPQTVMLEGETFRFEIDPYVKWRLLEGLDDISLTLAHEEEIRRFEQSRPAWLPRIEPENT